VTRAQSVGLLITGTLFVAATVETAPKNRVLRIIVTENADYTNGSAMPACFANTVPTSKLASAKNLDILEWRIETDSPDNACVYFDPESISLEFPSPSPVNNVKHVSKTRITANVNPTAAPQKYKYKVLMKDPAGSGKSYVAEDPELDIRGDMPPPITKKASAPATKRPAPKKK